MPTRAPNSRQMPKISIVMPAYNEAARIEQTLASISRYTAAGAPIGPVVLADDGSEDDTIEVAVRAARGYGLPIEVLRFPHRGKATTVREAMLEVAGRVGADYLMMLDADDELQIDQLDRVDWSANLDTIYIGRRVETAGGVEAVRPTLLTPRDVPHDASGITCLARHRVPGHPVRLQAVSASDRSRSLSPAALDWLDVRCRTLVHRRPRLEPPDRGDPGRVDAPRCESRASCGGRGQRTIDVRNGLSTLPPSLSTGGRPSCVRPRGVAERRPSHLKHCDERDPEHDRVDDRRRDADQGPGRHERDRERPPAAR